MSRKRQQETHAPQQIATLFDHLVGACKQRGRDCQPEHFSQEANPPQPLGLLRPRHHRPCHRTAKIV